MDAAFSREELLIGAEALGRLAAASVAGVGLGGVGSFAVEALARAGIGRLVLVDHDAVEESNLNRQLCALRGTIGRLKAEVMAERVLEINPEAEVEAHAERYCPDTAEALIRPELSYVVDAIDSISAKVELGVRAKGLGIPIVSVMGTGGKLDPTRLKVADLYATSVCPLARVMRSELRARGIESLDVVYSDERPAGPGVDREEGGGRRTIVGSLSCLPAAAGLAAASVVLRRLIAQPGISKTPSSTCLGA